MQESICHSMHLIYMFIGESNLSFYPPFCDEQLDEIGKHFSSRKLLENQELHFFSARNL